MNVWFLQADFFSFTKCEAFVNVVVFCLTVKTVSACPLLGCCFNCRAVRKKTFCEYYRAFLFKNIFLEEHCPQSFAGGKLHFFLKF